RLFSGKPPTSLREVSKRYGKLFSDVEKAWKKTLADAKKKAPPAALADADAEALRQLLYTEYVSYAQIKDVVDKRTGEQILRLIQSIQEWTNAPTAPPHALILEDA